MKKIKLFSLFLLSVVVFNACKKDDVSNSGEVITVQDYIFNKATKKLSTNEDLKVNISSPNGIKIIYSYLIRENRNDSLINTFYGANAENAKDFDYTISTSSYSITDLSQVKGIKLLIRNNSNVTSESFVNITYFDPVKPLLTGFPESLEADLTGGPTLISGKVLSEQGLKQVDVYDDYQTENTFVLSKSFADLNGIKDYNLSYAYPYRKASQHIKIVAVDIYNQTTELVLDMAVDMSAFVPKMLNLPVLVTPDLAFTGKITSPEGLKKIDIYDDKSGDYEIIATKDNLNSSKDYSFSYTYTLRKRATHIKIVAVDLEDVQSELIIPIKVTYGSVLYKDVEMNAQTLGTKNVFYDATGTSLGSCSLPAGEATMAFYLNGVSGGPTLYSPTNTGGAANAKCNGVGWVVGNANNLRATRFRTLLPSVTGTSAIAKLIKDGNLDKLDDDFLTENGIVLMGTIGGSVSKFDPLLTPANAVVGSFNATTVNLILVKIPDSGGAVGTTTYKNAIIHVKAGDFTSPVGNSTLKFDIYIQK